MEDSLQLELINASTPRKANLLFNLGNHCEDSLYYERAVFYFEQAAALPNVKELMPARFWYNLTNSLGIDHRDLGHFKIAEKWLLEAAAFSEERQLGFIGVYANLFDLYMRRNELKKAQHAAEKYLLLAQQSRSDDRMGMGNFLLGRLKMNANQYNQATRYFQHSLDLYKKSGNHSQICHALYQLGLGAYKIGQFAKARALFAEASADADINCRYLHPYILSVEGQIAAAEKKYPTAVNKENEALDMFNKSGDKQGQIQCLLHLAAIYEAQKKYETAILYAEQGKQKAAEIGDLYLLGVANVRLHPLYAANQRFKDAYFAASKNRITVDSIKLAAERVYNQVSNEAKAVEYQRNLAQQSLHTRNLQILTFTLAALGLIVFLIYRNRSLSAESRSLRLQEETRKKTEALRAFNYTVGHDLKSPVRNIQRILERFKLKYADKLDENGQMDLQKIDALTHETAAMLEGLLRYAEQDQLELNPGLFSTQRVVTFITQSLREAYPTASIHFQIGTLPDLLGDPLMLRQVFDNLLNNAVKFSAQQNPARIELFCDATETTHLFHIRDNGIGIPPDSLPHVFDLFKTAHDRGVFKGNGVGLAIVKRIVERHQGQIWIESTLQQGTTVFLALPKKLN